MKYLCFKSQITLAIRYTIFSNSYILCGTKSYATIIFVNVEIGFT